MAKVIEVIFTETRKGQFQIGQQKFVKTGYARNYLLPQKLAMLVTKENVQQLATLKKKASKKLEEIKSKAEEIKAVINGQKLEFKVKTHDEGRLYGSISAQDIAESLNRHYETSLDKYDVALPVAIKETGEYTVEIKVHNDVDISVLVSVLDEEEKEKKKAAAKAQEAEAKQEEAAEADVNEADEVNSEA